MLLKRSLQLTSLAFISTSVLALNDWSKPCFDGECAYDLPQSEDRAGSLKLFAPSHVLTDITPAAGWVILDCDPNLLEQEIRLVCETEHEGSGCQNLFDNSGPVNKVVRLPESCGRGPFARIASMTTAQDQSLPSHAQGKIQRRDGSAPQVHVMGIDDNFSAMDKPQDVNYAFVGAIGAETVSDIFPIPVGGVVKAVGELTGNDALKAAGSILSPGAIIVNPLATLFGTPKDAFNIKNWFKDAVTVVAKEISNAAQWVGEKWDDLKGLIKDKTKFTLRPTLKKVTIPINGPTLRFNKSAEWPSCTATATLDFDVELKTGGKIALQAGVIITGSLVEITNIAAFGALGGELNAQLKVGLKLSGGFHPPELPLVTELGIPGFSVPGLFSIGPYLSLHGKIVGQLDINLETTLNLQYTFKDIEMWYSSDKSAQPPVKNTQVNSKESEFGVAAAAEGTAQGFLKISLIPRINFGVSVGRSKAEANIHLAAEIWARALIEARATIAASNAAGKKLLKSRSRLGIDDADKVKPGGKYGNSGNSGNSANSNSKAEDAKSKAKADKGKAKAEKSGNSAESSSAISGTGFSGCFWVDAGFRLYGSGTGRIYKWSANVPEFNIYTSPTWDLYKNCWALGQSSAPEEKPSWAKDDLIKRPTKCGKRLKVPAKSKGKLAAKSLNK